MHQLSPLLLPTAAFILGRDINVGRYSHVNSLRLVEMKCICMMVEVVVVVVVVETRAQQRLTGM